MYSGDRIRKWPSGVLSVPPAVCTGMVHLSPKRHMFSLSRAKLQKNIHDINQVLFNNPRETIR